MARKQLTSLSINATVFQEPTNLLPPLEPVPPLPTPVDSIPVVGHSGSMICYIRQKSECEREIQKKTRIAAVVQDNQLEFPSFLRQRHGLQRADKPPASIGASACSSNTASCCSASVSFYIQQISECERETKK